MPAAARASRRTPAPVPAGPGPLVPCLLLRRGRVCRPSEDGPRDALAPDGRPLDPFDVLDRIVERYRLLYVVDLDGVDRGEPQLDYVQEFSRDIPLWVDAGVRHADQSIDVLVAGAERAVVSSATLHGPDELARAWSLSTELVFEVVLASGALDARPEWRAPDALGLVRSVRAVGLADVVVSPRGGGVDWELVRSIAAEGPTWVDGAFSPGQQDRLPESGATGGIFHIHEILDAMEGPASDPLPAARDDEEQNRLTRDE